MTTLDQHHNVPREIFTETTHGQCLEDRPILSVRDIDVDLGGRPVLRGINLEVRQGELVGLIGPNGAGKTTLLRTILHLTPKRRGSVSLHGHAARRKIGYVPQRHEFAWDFPLTVREAVLSNITASLGLFRRPRIEHQRAVERALARTDMKHLADRPVGELSGGQRQRVLVARALALQPAILLLDEPMTGLDMPTQEMLTGLFRSLADEGHAVIMTTHDLISARAVMDRLVLIRGEIIASGTPSELDCAQAWVETFQVGIDNPLLTVLGLKENGPVEEAGKKPAREGEPKHECNQPSECEGADRVVLKGSGRLHGTGHFVFSKGVGRC